MLHSDLLVLVTLSHLVWPLQSNRLLDQVADEKAGSLGSPSSTSTRRWPSPASTASATSRRCSCSRRSVVAKHGAQRQQAQRAARRPHLIPDFGLRGRRAKCDPAHLPRRPCPPGRVACLLAANPPPAVASTSPSDSGPSLGYTLCSPPASTRAHRRRHPQFASRQPRLPHLFAARLVSLFGDWFNTPVSPPALLGHTGAATGWVVILKTLPPRGLSHRRRGGRSPALPADPRGSGCRAAAQQHAVPPNVEILYVLVALQSMASASEPARTALPPTSCAKKSHRSECGGCRRVVDHARTGRRHGGIVTAYLGWSVALSLDVLTCWFRPPCCFG